MFSFIQVDQYIHQLKKDSQKVFLNLSMIHNIKVIAWKFSFDDKSNIEYDRNIGKYILKEFCLIIWFSNT